MAGEVFVVEAKKAVLPALAAHWRLPCVAGSTAFFGFDHEDLPGHHGVLAPGGGR